MIKATDKGREKNNDGAEIVSFAYHNISGMHVRDVACHEQEAKYGMHR